MLILLLKGFIIGISIAAPVGPIGILCINRTIRYGFGSGFVSGCGAATADGCYGLVAGLGLTIISSILLKQQELIHLIGGIFLVYFGGKILFAPPHTKGSHISRNSLYKNYLTTFLLTITNPMTILSFMGVYAGLGIATGITTYTKSTMFVIGVIIGSLTWWLLLCWLIKSFFNSKLIMSYLRFINIISGSIIVIFGATSLVRFI